MENTDLKPRHQLRNFNRYARDGNFMLCSGIVVFLAILLILCFHGYIHHFLNLRRRRRRHSHRQTLSISADNVAAAGSGGLGRSILKALPVFAYRSKTHDAPLECAVCLSEFEDGEEGRVLPECKHTFHMCCIDMWFRSHSNCPLCRAPVQYVAVSEISAETVVPVSETAGLPSELAVKKEDERCCSASSSPAPGSLPPVECPRIALDLVGILVEVPTPHSRGS